ncbi:hypothetical protein CFC21_049789, partial [Triticum aestivum]
GDLRGEQLLHVKHDEALFADLGVSSTTVHELDKDPQGEEVERALAGMV